MGCCGIPGKNNEGNFKKQKNLLGTTEHLSPLDLLKIRLVKGELTFEEYEEIKAKIS